MSEREIDFDGPKAPDYGKFAPQPNDSKLKELKSLVDEARMTAELIKNFTTRTEAETRRFKELTEKRIPEMMQDVGLKELKTEQGLKVTLEPQVFGTVPSPSAINDEKDPVKRAALIARRDAGLQWLRDNGHGDLIKHAFEFEFDTSEGEWAEEFKAEVSNHKRPPNYVEGCTVHHKKLSSLLQRLQSQGKTFPEDIFNAYPRTVAKFSGRK